MSGWKLPIYAFLAMIVVGLQAGLRSAWFTTLAAAIAGVAAIGVFQYRGARGSLHPLPPPEPDASPWIPALERMVELDLLIREADLDAALVEQVEGTIDALRDLIPHLSADYGGSELTFTVNRMASDYLPRVLEPFARLPSRERAKNEAELREGLAGLDAELENIQNLVRRAMEGEFQSRAAFLRARFLDDPSA